MNILIVDGNEKEPSDNYVQLGMDTQYDVYLKILRKLTKNSLNFTAHSHQVFQGNSDCQNLESLLFW